MEFLSIRGIVLATLSVNMNIYTENLIKQKPDVTDNIAMPARVRQ
jgi:hypothetical protein